MNENGKNKYISYFFILFTALSPSFVEQASNQCADAPLAFFYALGFVSYFLSIEGGAQSFPSKFFFSYAVLITALLVLIKNEGALLAIPLILYFLYKPVMKKDYSLLFPVMFFTLIPFTLILYYKYSAKLIYLYPLRLDKVFLHLSHIARYKVLIKNFLYDHVLMRGGLILYLLFKPVSSRLPIIIPMIASFILYNLVFVVIQQDFIWQVTIAYDRITLHFYPALIIIFLSTSRFAISKSEEGADLDMRKHGGSILI